MRITQPDDDDRGLNFGSGAVTVLLCLILAIMVLVFLAGCGSVPVKPYDRTKLAQGFTKTEDALADARKYTQDAKDEARGIKSNSKLIDNKAEVILRHWNDK